MLIAFSRAEQHRAAAPPLPPTPHAYAPRAPGDRSMGGGGGGGYGGGSGARPGLGHGTASDRSSDRDRVTKKSDVRDRQHPVSGSALPFSTINVAGECMPLAMAMRFARNLLCAAFQIRIEGNLLCAAGPFSLRIRMFSWPRPGITTREHRTGPK